MKKLSCGIIVRDKNGKLLACHPSGRPNFDGNYDIPKGLREPEKDNSDIDTAIRELYEETGIMIPNNDMLKDLGTFKYLKDKDLHLWLFQLNNSFEETKFDLKCNSYFELGDKKFPEISYYMYVDRIETFYPSLQKVLRQIKEIQ